MPKSASVSDSHQDEDADALAVRDELLGFLRRDQSVNLVVRAHEDVAWRPLLDAVAESVPDLLRIDLQDGRTASLRGFVREVLRACRAEREVPAEPAEALVVLSETLQARPTTTRLALLHFDRALERYGSDLFGALRYLVMEQRKLVLLVQSYRPFHELVPADHELSRIDLKTVELKRRAPGREPRLALESLRIRGFKNLEDLKIDFRHGSDLEGDWTCVAGVNGSGKSSILQAICLLLLGRRRATELGEERLRQMLRRFNDESQPALLEATLREGEQLHRLRLPLGRLGVDETRFGDCDLEALTALWERLGERLLVSYGATRNLSTHRDTRYVDSSRVVQRQMTLFDPLSQIAAVDVLLEPARVAPATFRTLKELLTTVLEDNDLGLTLELDWKNGLLFQTGGAKLEAVDLPDGFRSLVAWLADLCAAWHETPAGQDASGAPAEITGIVLLDEIDLHLHPALQRTLVPRLRKALPDVQWIVTTHSPLILASFDRSEIVLLDRDAEGGVRPLDRQILGFSSDQVYRWLMGTSPYSAAIEDKLEREDDDVPLLLEQDEHQNEEQARQELVRWRERVERLKQRKPLR